MRCSLPRQRRRIARVAVAAAVGIVVLCVRREEDRWCSSCWARMGATAWYLVGLPPWRARTWVVEDPAPGVARFLPPDHVHDAATPNCVLRTDGVLPWAFSLVGTSCSFGRPPSEFAATLRWDPRFADYVAARVQDGRIDIGTVRRLIAVPRALDRGGPRRSDDPEISALMTTGTELYAEYRRTDPTLVELWNGSGLGGPEPHFLPRGR